MRLHKTLRVTPAMPANVTDRLWSLEELVERTHSRCRARAFTIGSPSFSPSICWFWTGKTCEESRWKAARRRSAFVTDGSARHRPVRAYRGRRRARPCSRVQDGAGGYCVKAAQQYLQIRHLAQLDQSKNPLSAALVPALPVMIGEL